MPPWCQSLGRDTGDVPRRRAGHCASMKQNAPPRKVPLSRLSLQSRLHPNDAPAKRRSEGIAHGKAHLVGMKGRHCAYLWLFNHEAAWKHVVFEKRQPKGLGELPIVLEGLGTGSFRIQWLDTWSGEVVKEQITASAEGELQLVSPAFEKDIACRVERL